MTTMRAAQVQQAGGPFVVTDMPIPEPKPGQIRVKVYACGICGGDAIPRNALFGTVLPRVPGHEIAGVVDAVGDGVEVWEVGQRVGVGWSGGVDFTCEYCRRGDFTNCRQPDDRRYVVRRWLCRIHGGAAGCGGPDPRRRSPSRRRRR